MNKLDHKYLNIINDIITSGNVKVDRTGIGTMSIFNKQIEHDFKNGFPILTCKKVIFKSVVEELLWFLRGDTKLRSLLERDVHIWTGDAYKVYDKDFDAEHPPFSAPYPPRFTMQEFEQKIMEDDEFNKMYGDLGPIYGKQWRSWTNYPSDEWVPDTIDQIQNLIHDLKTNPDSRRLMVNAWNVGELDQMVLPPCHYGFQVYTRELTWEERIQWVLKNTDVELENLYIVDELNKESTPTRAISLMWNQRSADVLLGLPFNISSYGLLLMILGKITNMVPDKLIGTIGDAHLYSNHIDIAKKLYNDSYIDYLDNQNVNLSTTGLDKIKKVGLFKALEDLTYEDFKLEGYNPFTTVKAPLNN